MRASGRHFLQGFVLQKPFIEVLGLRGLFQPGCQHGGLKGGDAPVPVIHAWRFQHLAVFGIGFTQTARIRTQGGIPHPGHQNKFRIRFRIAYHRAEHGGGGVRIPAGKKQTSQAVLGVHFQIILFRIADHELVILDSLVRFPGSGGVRRQAVGGSGNQSRAARLGQPAEQGVRVLLPAELLQAHGGAVLRQGSLGGLGETLGKFKILAQAQIKQAAIFLPVCLRRRFLGLLVQHVRHVQGTCSVGDQRTVRNGSGVRNVFLRGGRTPPKSLNLH